MEVKSAEISVVAAYRASAACLIDQRRLCPSAMSRDLLGTATYAAVITPALQHELATTVPGAVPTHISIATDEATSAVLRPKPVLPQPMTHGCLAAVNPFRDLTRRQALVYKRRQDVPIDASPWCCHTCMVSLTADGETERMFPCDVIVTHDVGLLHGTRTNPRDRWRWSRLRRVDRLLRRHRH